MKTCFALLSAATAMASCHAADAYLANLKFGGFLQYRYEWTQNPRGTADTAVISPSLEGDSSVDSKSQTRTKLCFSIDNQFDGYTRFHAIVSGESLGGRTIQTTVEVKEAFVAAKFGPSEIAVGRFITDIGFGTIGCGPYADGVRAVADTEKVSAQVYVVKFGEVLSPTLNENGTVTNNPHYTFVMSDVKVRPLPGLTLAGALFRDVTSKDSDIINKSFSFGAEYKLLSKNQPWLTITGEYAKNTGAMAKVFNTDVVTLRGKNPYSYYATTKLLGANPFEAHTYGLALQYRHAEAGLNPQGFSSASAWNAPFNWSTPGQGGFADNCKGFELSGEVTVLPRTVLKAAYGFMKTVNMNAALMSSNKFGYTRKTDMNSENENYCTASIFYIF